VCTRLFARDIACIFRRGTRITLPLDTGRRTHACRTRTCGTRDRIYVTADSSHCETSTRPQSATVWSVLAKRLDRWFLTDLEAVRVCASLYYTRYAVARDLVILRHCWRHLIEVKNRGCCDLRRSASPKQSSGIFISSSSWCFIASPARRSIGSAGLFQVPVPEAIRLKTPRGKVAGDDSRLEISRRSPREVELVRVWRGYRDGRVAGNKRATWGYRIQWNQSGMRTPGGSSARESK
jgi:hypothetical protein